MTPRHVTVCICTFKRPVLLQRLLETLERQKTGGAFSYSIVVADNDAARSAEEFVTSFARRSPIPTVYCNQPQQNIAMTRNKALANATGDFIAFIDDDEFPTDEWLALMVKACDEYQASGILGPVRPHFDETPPTWLEKGRFCWRPEPPTGTIMAWAQSRTGNLLFQRSIIGGMDEPFRHQFGTGDEDKDFFKRMTERGHVFRWCNEAVVYETVPPSRWTRGYYLRRALLRGRNVLKHPEGRVKLVATSLIATPLYLMVLPFTLLGGQHVFMKYLIKLCDHGGRLLALIGLNPVNDRQM